MESTEGLGSWSAEKDPRAKPASRTCPICGKEFMPFSATGHASSRKICYTPSCEITRDKEHRKKNAAARKARYNKNRKEIT